MSSDAGARAPFEPAAPNDELSFREQVAIEVRAWMKRRGWTARQIAQEMNVSDMYVGRRLNGGTAFDIEDLAAFSRILNVPMATLLGRPVTAFDAATGAAGEVTESATSAATSITQGRRGPNAEKCCFYTKPGQRHGAYCIEGDGGPGAAEDAGHLIAWRPAA